MGITINNKGTWNQLGDIVDGNKTVTNGMSKEDMERLMESVRESGVSKDDIDSLIQVLKDINDSQNDLTTEFAKMCADYQAPKDSGTMVKIREGVSFTSGMVTLGQAAIGIATKNPTLALPAVLETAKELVK